MSKADHSVSTSEKSGRGIPFAIVADYDDIKRFVASLGPSAQGTRRIFRGQTSGYFDATSDLPSLLPALARTPGRSEVDPAWLVSVELYAATRGETPSSLTYRFGEIWGPALLQHYGPGSRYLDVTADLDIALWFALAKRYERWIEAPTSIGKTRRLRVAWHSDLAAGQCGDCEVYVFDATPWNGAGPPAHGEIVDLLERENGNELPMEALRLQAQHGSLLYCDPDHPQGANLGKRLKGYMRLTPDFERESAPSFGRAVTDFYPPPDADPFYRALLAVPASVRFNPDRLEHPLAIPCYLPGEPQSSSAETPVVPSGNDSLGPFFGLGAAMTPPMLYPYLLTENPSLSEPAIPSPADGRRFRFADATPIVIEAPYTRYLPPVDLDLDESDWIQSALPIGIATSLLDRPTENVYVEFSPADVFFPRNRARDPNDDSGSVRAVWLVRAGSRYWTTAYLQSPLGIMSLYSEFRFIPTLGRFFRVKPNAVGNAENDETPQVKDLYDLAAKGLFAVLTLLRDLSPGLKPPPIFATGVVDKGGNPETWLVGSLLEPQLARVETVKGAPFLFPKAINGKTYARGYGVRASEDWKNSDEGLQALARAFGAIRELNYLVEAGAELAEIYGQRNQLTESLNVARFALATVQAAPTTHFLRGCEAVFEVFQGRALFGLDVKDKALQAFQRALAIRREQADERHSSEIAATIERLFGPQTRKDG